MSRRKPIPDCRDKPISAMQAGNHGGYPYARGLKGKLEFVGADPLCLP